jgi:hypothetical protein
MKLHNFCIDHYIEVSIHHYHEGIWPSDEWEVNGNTCNEDLDLRGRSTGNQRRDITSQLEQDGILQPLHASINSHC